MVTAQRFAQGMTFPQYCTFVGTPDNLKREGAFNRPRKDYGDFFRTAYEATQLTEAQRGALAWLAAQPGGPAKVLVISEDWSSDCRRDVPVIARLADTAGWELRIFTRDGQKISSTPAPDPKESPNADLMAQFLRRRDGQTFQSIPIAAFYTKDFQHLYTYLEFPAIYHKDRVVGAIRAAKPGEPKEAAMERGLRDFFAFQDTPMFRLFAGATADEIIAMLHERLRVGSLA
ncbi:MAG TPA: thioredoxin family protein [Methylomirabilota bacterium]|nr:thioredoxin family protein [Methylomirabilota bacterium]